MKTRHAHVVKARHLVAERLGGEGRLLGDGQVARAGRGDHDRPEPVWRAGRAEPPQSRHGEIGEAVAQRRRYHLRLRLVHACGEGRRLTVGAKRREDGGDLLRRLTGPVDHLRHALPPQASEVNACEIEVVDVGFFILLVHADSISHVRPARAICAPWPKHALPLAPALRL